MKYLNHVTLNSGHMRKTYPSEIDKKIYFIMKRIFKDSLTKEGAELLPGYRLKTTQEGGSAIATIFASVDDAPILTTGCSKFDHEGIWKIMHESAYMALQTKSTDPAPIPFIADRLEPGAVFHMDAMQWTGDFSRCFGWIVLDPRKIR